MSDPVRPPPVGFGDLFIGGSGSIAVATDELYDKAQQLREVAREAASIGAQLAGVDELMSPLGLLVMGAPWAAQAAESALDQGRITMIEIEAQARLLDWALGTAADGYGFAEKFVGHLMGKVTGGIGGLLGTILSGTTKSTIGGAALLGGLGGFVAGSNAGGGLGNAIARSGGPPGDSEFVSEHNALITNPLAVELVRAVAQSTGSVAAGAVGIPPWLTASVDGSGVIVGALAVAGAGASVGLLAETPVRLVSSTPLPATAAPRGFVERLRRIPVRDEVDGAQVIIEKYSTGHLPARFEVYISGTASFSPVATDEPFDMTSNISNAYGGTSGAYKSVLLAMQHAGVTADSPVQFTGYSQGGGTAASLAASGHFNTQGLATFGGPTGQVPIPEGFPTVLVEHTDDIVPALGGEQGNQHAVIVRREAFDGIPVPTDQSVPAHRIPYYALTARMMDDAHNEYLVDAAARLDAFGADAGSVTSTAYRFERVSSPSSAGAGGSR